MPLGLGATSGEIRMPNRAQANIATVRSTRPNCRTTAEVRKAIRESPETLDVLARRYGINPKTVAKWKKRVSTDDLPTGPKLGRQRRISADEEEFIVLFRKHTLLPLDDCHYALQARIPHLTRSSLHRCLLRHGISRLAKTFEDDRVADRPEAIPVGRLHIDRASVPSTKGEHFLFSAIDEASRFAFVELTRSNGPAGAASFLATLLGAVPFRIERAITSDCGAFADWGRAGSFTRLCREHGIEHLEKSRPHPWAQNPVARMGRTIQDSVTVTSEAYLADLLRDFLPGRTPFAFVCHAWEQEPARFLQDPHHLIVGLETTPGPREAGI
jgi:hypothetical protein